jgi:hypothetical protein
MSIVNGQWPDGFTIDSQRIRSRVRRTTHFIDAAAEPQAAERVGSFDQ